MTTCNSERVPPFTALTRRAASRSHTRTLRVLGTGVNRVHFHSTCHGLLPDGVEGPVPQSPKPIRKHWGPSRRHASHDASSTPAPGTRDGVTARHNPTPPACEPAHRGRTGRQADGTARVRPPSNGGRSPGAVSGAVQGDTASLPGRRTRHTPRGAHVPSTNRSTPMRRNLAPVGVGTGPTPPRARGNLGVVGRRPTA